MQPHKAAPLLQHQCQNEGCRRNISFSKANKMPKNSALRESAQGFWQGAESGIGYQTALQQYGCGMACLCSLRDGKRDTRVPRQIHTCSPHTSPLNGMFVLMYIIGDGDAQVKPFTLWSSTRPYIALCGRTSEPRASRASPVKIGTVPKAC